MTKLTLRPIDRLCHYGAELWGFNKGLNLERMQLRFFKRLLGLDNKFNELVLRGGYRSKVYETE